MVIILMMPAKMATLALLKIKLFCNKCYDVIILSMASPTKFTHATQIILWIWSYDQSLVTAAPLWQKLSQPQIYKNLARKTTFLKGGLGSSSIIWDWQ